MGHCDGSSRDASAVATAQVAANECVVRGRTRRSRRRRHVGIDCLLKIYEMDGGDGGVCAFLYGDVGSRWCAGHARLGLGVGYASGQLLLLVLG